MNTIIKNGKSSKMKLISLPKINQDIINNSQSKTELKSKNNYIAKEKGKNLFINSDQNNNVTPLENKINPDQNYVFNYDNDINNILANEKSTRTDDSSGEEKKTRKIQVQTPLNLTDKFNESKNILLNQKMNKISLSLSLMNYISNKPCTNNASNLHEMLENKNDFKNNEIKKAIYYKDHNIKKEQKNDLNAKLFTDANCFKNNQILEKKEKNLYTQNFVNAKNCKDNDNIKKVFIKNKSYDCLKRITLKNIDIINENKNKIPQYKDDNEVYHYIKVNKKINNININNNDNNETKINKKDNDKINNKNKKISNLNNNKNSILKNQLNNRNIIKMKNRGYNTEIGSNRKSKIKRNSFKKIETINKNNNINKTEQINRKAITAIDNNKLENNIFLDKTYQNRFKKNQKNKNIIQNDIFTSDKQKEYNELIVKKKSNYFSNQIINSNNSSNSSNESNKDWVYRLYNKEIKKQKIKDKIILLLRKSILNEPKTEKKLAKSKTVKEFKNYNYPINEGYNIDDNFNIINLFLSDDKKMRKKNYEKKKKKIKKCQSFHSHRNKKQRRNSYDDNKIGDEKIDKLIEDKIYLKNHRSYKKFRLLYNEELIDDEEEEKENDEEELKI